VNLDWNPCWSEDGRYLYFESDRDGTWNVWRVAIDEETGEPRGPAQPVTLPARFVMQLRVAAGGRRLVFQSFEPSFLLEAHGFDPAAMRSTGVSSAVLRFAFQAISDADVSPDGSRICFASVGPVRNVYVVGSDGSNVVRLTNDADVESIPRFSPDGRQIAFRSNRGGLWRIWSVPSDGGALTPVADDAKGPPVWAPDGAALAYASSDGWRILRWEDGRTSTETMRPPAGGSFVPSSWSRDGSRILGVSVLEASSRIVGYRLRDAVYEPIEDAPETPGSNQATNPVYLPDGRGILYVTRQGVRVWDSRSRSSRLVFETQETAPIEDFAIAPGATTVYVSRQVDESDIWMGEIQ
jgi:Tol biopolymer transport system component